ncbi:endonuclease/exonuclease/phosphatase family protein [Rhodopirellula halodulae]|uniref:endonuclease/exonuclease/phosphatase family protein n=1 Tax=Rhodopirellula halodulae TaxID=2894198 RepID=UPI001E3D31B1|nr:endonuclease/exonuclease/phosphatase family protein [Rhodopirellula sp. JC737]MCC9658338.1 endonuclease/exonuclease/phosphatase family protein [Rhodopirellula sp. JC737]
MQTALNVAIYLLFAVLIFGSLAPLSSHPHWFIRGWDFPRFQLVLVTVAATAIFVWMNHSDAAMRWNLWVIAALGVTISLWHLFRIIPYTPLTKPQVAAWKSTQATSNHASQRRLRLLVTNVEMENDKYETWTRVVKEADADMVIAAEISEDWLPAIESLKADLPNQIVYPQDNWYGMAMLSRLPIEKHAIRFRVQDDIPSIDAMIELESGELIRVIGVHPRPPEPIRDNDSTARDAELVLWGKELAEDHRPIVIGGDLNDVAWSPSTRLFLRLSRLLDPRRGRGFFNSFHADRWWMRFPLDHVFHSDHFAIREIRRLEHVGSDHFPILIDLQLQPSMQREHEPLEQKSTDEEDAKEKLERAAEAELVEQASEPTPHRSPAVQP